MLLNRFEVIKLLGAGNFAKVYLARNVRTDEMVAIKEIDKEKIFKKGMVVHIKREISVMRRVRHPNIVRLYEVMATKSKIYLVMEYVRGGELFQRVRKGRLRNETARKFFQQLISSMSFCHARGVYHRDLKPENLLIDHNGNLKVSDFGLSAVVEQRRGDEMLHTLCGTPDYIAPEVLKRKGYDGAKADIWSSGVILFVLMAGYTPFSDRSLSGMIKKIYRGEYRCPRWFSAELVRLIRGLLATDPSKRLSIPEIMENSWFKVGFRHVQYYEEGDQFRVLDDDDESGEGSNRSSSSNDTQQNESLSSDSGYESDSSVCSCPEVPSEKQQGLPFMKPPSLNAFDIISFSRGFDLSGLFEETGEETRFLSRETVSNIISNLEGIAKIMSFKVRRKDTLVSLEGRRESPMGPLTIVAEIFEITPVIVVVHVKKKQGDKGEYEEFLNKVLKPRMRHLVESPIVRSPAHFQKTPSPVIKSIRASPAYI